MKNTQIGLSEEFPYCIRDNNVYCSTLCKNGEWERSPLDENVKAFRIFESAEEYVRKKGFGITNIVIPYKEWEEQEDKFKMGVYENGRLVDMGYYKTEEEAEEDFKNYDEPKGRTHIIEAL